MKAKNIELSFSIENENYLSVLEDDDNILLTKMYVVSTGDSRPVSLNGKPCITNFSLEGIKKASKTLVNKPMVCVWNKWQEDFKNHAFTKQEIQERVAIGVIPESCDMEYEIINDKTFLVCKVAFWKKYFPSEIRKIAENTLNGKATNLSMEISVLNGHYENETYFIIDEFKFEGVSLLGENISTGIADAQMNTVKFSSVEDVISETNKILTNYNQNNEKGERQVELTKNQIREILDKALSEFKIEGDEPYGRFYVCDFDSSYVYVEDRSENWTAKRMEYTLDTENLVATVNIETLKSVIRGGYLVVEDGESVETTYEEAIINCKALEVKCSDLEVKCNELETKCTEYETLKTNFSSVNDELSTLKEETVTKYARLLELEGLFSKQEKDSLTEQAKVILEERKVYFSEDEITGLMAEFEEKYLSKEGLATFSTIVKAQAEPKIQVELESLRQSLSSMQQNNNKGDIDFSQGAIIDNVKPQEALDVWGRLGIKVN